MATRGSFQTTKLKPLLEERGIDLSREQIYRLVTHPPQRVRIDVLAALCDALDCSLNDLVTITRRESTALPKAVVGEDRPAARSEICVPFGQLPSSPSQIALLVKAGKQTPTGKRGAPSLVQPVVPGVPVERLAELVIEVAPAPVTQRLLELALLKQPGLLQGQCRNVPVTVQDLAHALVQEGASRVVLPTCESCGRALRMPRKHRAGVVVVPDVRGTLGPRPVPSAAE